jgi:hypothetical protein
VARLSWKNVYNKCCIECTILIYVGRLAQG